MYTNKHTMPRQVFYKKELLLDFLLFLSSYPLFYCHVKFINLLVHEWLAKLQWCWASLFIPRFITSTSRTIWFFSFALSLFLLHLVFEYSIKFLLPLSVFVSLLLLLLPLMFWQNIYLSKFKFFDFTRSNPGDEKSILTFNKLGFTIMEVKFVSMGKLQNKKKLPTLSQKKATQYYT